MRFVIGLCAALASTACFEVVSESPVQPLPVAASESCCYVPTPEPTPVPTASPTPDPNPGHIPDSVPDNTNAVVAVDLKVYFVECDGAEVEGSTYASHAAVGCRVHFDGTPQDRVGRHTRSYQHQWYFSGPGQPGGLSSMTPTVTGTQAGTVTAQVWVDGIMSNSVQVTFY